MVVACLIAAWLAPYNGDCQSIVRRDGVHLMATRRSFVIAIENRLDPAGKRFPHAEAGASRLAESWGSLSDNGLSATLLLGPQATKTAIDWHWQNFLSTIQEGDTILIALVGTTLIDNNETIFLPWDNLAVARSETGLSVVEIVTQTMATPAMSILFLFDFQPFDDDKHFRPKKLQNLLNASANAAALCSVQPGEVSYGDASLKSTFFLYGVCEALNGDALDALDEHGQLIASTLHHHLEAEMPRWLRRHVPGHVVQRPMLLGGIANLSIADYTQRLQQTDNWFDRDRFKRVVFRSLSFTKVKDLSRFAKGFRVPDHASKSSKQFVARTATPDVHQDLDMVFAECRATMGYRRKDVEVELGDDGQGTLRTPEFEYSISATCDDDDPSRVRWTREVGQIANPNLIRTPEYEQLFGKLFDMLVFEFETPIDVARIIDRLEDAPIEGMRLDVTSNADACTIQLKGFPGSIELEPTTLTIAGRGESSAGLLDLFLAFLQTVGPLGERLALPGK